MDYVRVCAIDVGTRNFAYCVVDNNHWREPRQWNRVDLWEPKAGRSRKPSTDDVVCITHRWCDENRQMLLECDVIMLEKQMRTTFIVMNTVIQSLFFTRTRVVSPMTVGSFFNLPKTREAKKAAGVSVCRKYARVDDVAQVGKLDDLADTWMMAMYGLVQRGALTASEFE